MGHHMMAELWLWWRTLEAGIIIDIIDYFLSLMQLQDATAGPAGCDEAAWFPIKFVTLVRVVSCFIAFPFFL